MDTRGCFSNDAERTAGYVARFTTRKRVSPERWAQFALKVIERSGSFFEALHRTMSTLQEEWSEDGECKPIWLADTAYGIALRTLFDENVKDIVERRKEAVLPEPPVGCCIYPTPGLKEYLESIPPYKREPSSP